MKSLLASSKSLRKNPPGQRITNVEKVRGEPVQHSPVTNDDKPDRARDLNTLGKIPKAMVFNCHSIKNPDRQCTRLKCLDLLVSGFFFPCLSYWTEPLILAVQRFGVYYERA